MRILAGQSRNRFRLPAEQQSPFFIAPRLSLQPIHLDMVLFLSGSSGYGVKLAAASLFISILSQHIFSQRFPRILKSITSLSNVFCILFLTRPNSYTKHHLLTSLALPSLCHKINHAFSLPASSPQNFNPDLSLPAMNTTDLML
jgi:hypothetical protein